MRSSRIPLYIPYGDEDISDRDEAEGGHELDVEDNGDGDSWWAMATYRRVLADATVLRARIHEDRDRFRRVQAAQRWREDMKRSVGGGHSGGHGSSSSSGRRNRSSSQSRNTYTNMNTGGPEHQEGCLRSHGSSLALRLAAMIKAEGAHVREVEAAARKMEQTWSQRPRGHQDQDHDHDQDPRVAGRFQLPLLPQEVLPTARNPGGLVLLGAMLLALGDGGDRHSSRTSARTVPLVRSVYQRWCRRWHPDKVGRMDVSRATPLLAAMQSANEIWSTIQVDMEAEGS